MIKNVYLLIDVTVEIVLVFLSNRINHAIAVNRQTY